MSIHIAVLRQMSTAHGLLRLCVTMLTLTLVSCDRGTPKDLKDGTQSSKETVQDTVDEATLTYGYAPIPNPAVTYQPEVIFIEGGPHAIHSVSGDGIVWTIDGHAKGAKDLRPGSIMFATGRAAGRVLQVEPRGDDLAVTLGPANLGEFIRDAHIDLDVTLSPKDFTYQLIPDLPGMYRDLQASTSIESRAYASAQHDDPILFQFPWTSIANAAIPLYLPSPGPMPYASKGAIKFQVGNYEIEPSIKEDLKSGKGRQRLGLKVLRKFESMETKGKSPDGNLEWGTGLKLGIDWVIWMTNMHFQTTLTYDQGKLGSKDFRVEFGDFDGLEISIISGAENGLKDNQKFRIEIPLDMSYQIPPSPETLGIPLIIHFKFKFLVEPAFSVKNSTLREGAPEIRTV